MDREVRATKGRPEGARTDAGAVLRPYSTDEGGEPQGSRKGRPRNPLEGRGKHAYESAERKHSEKGDAEKVLAVLPKRFEKYGLTPNFLGFVHLCARSRQGRFTVHV